MTQELLEWQYCTLSGTTARVVSQSLDMLFCATVLSQIRPIQVRELEWALYNQTLSKGLRHE